MKTIYIYCEGPTEESFINTVLYPYFFALGIYVRPIVCETRRDANRKYRGGVSRYAKIKSELMILCKSHPHEYVTTMFDYQTEGGCIFLIFLCRRSRLRQKRQPCSWRVQKKLT